MNTHPTPFPGQRRPAAVNPVKKERDRAKPSTQPSVPTRQKRAFGIARSTNIPVEKPTAKPQPAKTSRPWKPSGNGTQKAKVDTSRNQPVCFPKPEQEAEANGTVRDEKILQNEGDQTPVLSLIRTLEGTPYQTAEDCSKCRFDKLETTAYWLAQIKMAESVEKHFVSAAFFRLASECDAQPFRSLQRELRHYVARHKSISSETLWNDVCKVYGLSTEKSGADSDPENFDAVLVKQEDTKSDVKDDVNPETLEDECFDFDIIDNILPSGIPEKEIGELIDANLTITDAENFINVKKMPASLEETGLKPTDRDDSGETILKSVERNASGKKPENNLLSNASPRSSGGSSAKKGQEILKPVRKTAGSKPSKNVQLRNQGKADENQGNPGFGAPT